MRKLLLVAAILCSSSNILSTYGGKKQKAEQCEDFEPISKACYAMQSGGAEGLCKRNWLFFFVEVCSFSCSENGQIRLANCHRCDNKEKEYPCCDDLMCKRITTEKDTNSTPKEVTTEKDTYTTSEEVTAEKDTNSTSEEVTTEKGTYSTSEEVTTEKDTNSTSEEVTPENSYYNIQKPISESTTGYYDNDVEVIAD